MSRASNVKACFAKRHDSMALSNRKTSATAEARSEKHHFYKPLPKEFQRNGFSYRLIAREGNAAIYEQSWSGSRNRSVCYEVIRIRRREGFQIDSRFVEPSEVYPKSESWGADGFTFTDWNKAQAKFFQISLEEPATRGKEVI